MGIFLVKWTSIVAAIVGGTLILGAICLMLESPRRSGERMIARWSAYILAGGVFSACSGLFWLALILLLSGGTGGTTGKGALTLTNALALNGLAGIGFVGISRAIPSINPERQGRLIAGLLGSVNIGIFMGLMVMGMVVDDVNLATLKIGLRISQLVGGLLSGAVGGFLCGNDQLFAWLMQKFNHQLPGINARHHGWLAGATTGVIIGSWVTSGIAFGSAHGFGAGLAMIVMGALVAMGTCLFMVPIGGIFGGVFVGLPLTAGVLFSLRLSQQIAWKLAALMTDARAAHLPDSLYAAPFPAQTSSSTTPVQPVRPPEPGVTIERDTRQSVRILIPYTAFGFLRGQNVLTLNAEEIRLKGMWGIFGEHWRVPIDALRPSSITWFFKEKALAVGVNYKKKTRIISAQLGQAEVAKLCQQLREFVTTMRPKTGAADSLTDAPHWAQTAASDRITFTLPTPVGGFRFIAVIAMMLGIFSFAMYGIMLAENEPVDEIRSMLYFGAVEVGVAALGVLLGWLADRQARQTLDITATGLTITRTVFGLRTGERREIAATTFETLELTWYYKDAQPVIGLHANRTTAELLLARFSPAELDALIHAIRQALHDVKNGQVPVANAEVRSPVANLRPEAQSAARALPGSDIETIRLADHAVQLRIPGRFNEIVQKQMIFPIILVVFFGFINFMMLFGNGETTDAGRVAQPVLLLIWLASVGGVGMVLHHIWGLTLIDLNPEWTRVTYTLFGLKISRQVLTSAITTVEVTHRYTINNSFHVEGIDIHAEGKTLKFGSHLPRVEKDWLAAEITAYRSAWCGPQGADLPHKRLRVTPDGLEITLPARHLPFQAGFHLLWLTGWTVGGGFAIGYLISSLTSEGKIQWFLLVWTVFWVLGEISVIKILLNHFFGQETIRINSTHLRLEYRLLRWQKAAHYELARIRNLTLAPEPLANARNRLVETGKLTFAYDGQPVAFARYVTATEASALQRALTAILDSRCHVVEHICFGAFADTDSAVTLHNPDVTELTLPFAQLRRISIDAATCDWELAERFLTYAVNYIGQDRLKQQVEAHLYGDPAALPVNLRNSLANLCQKVDLHPNVITSR